MEYKYLTRKQYVLDAGIKEKGLDTIVPFDNMEVEVIDTFVPGDKVTLATEEKMEALINASVVSSHKVITGELEVADAAAAAQALVDYAAGKDLTFTNGRIFNNGNSSPGEVFFMVPAAGSTVKAEELIVGSTKELIALSNENTIDAQFKAVEDRVTAVETDKADIADFTPVKDQVDLNTPAITTNSTDIVTLNNDLATNTGNIKSNADDIVVLKADVVRIDAKDVTQDGRLEALETRESLDDKVWTGSLNGVNSLSNIVDQNGDKFEFATDKKLELVFESPAFSEEESKIVTIDSPNWATYSLGNLNFGVKINSSGLLSLGKLANGAADAELTDVNLIEIIEAKATPNIAVSYTKNESDAKYATLTALDIVDKKVDAIDLTTKQDAIDSSLQTTTKSVVGAINELDGKIKINDPLIARIGGLKTSDGDDLSTTTEEIMTVKTMGAKGYMTEAQVDAKIAAALSTVMSVTFDDASTGQYKLGK